MQHEDWMRRCLELAIAAQGQTAPNPLVGSVVVQDGECVGEGFHPKAGQPHAEIFALRSAGDRAQGATLYVNLEPCNHYGRTPPCTEAIIAAGIKTVVVGMVDPNPKVAGRGIERLQQAGIAVVVNVLQAECERLNEAFIHRILYRQPFGILKYAMTLDGKIAATGGHSAWVTSPESRRRVHQLRSICDAVIVGGNTVRQDDPRLTCHGVSDRNPLRVVMTRRLDLPKHANLWQTDVASTLICTETRPSSEIQQYLNANGVEIQEFAELTPKAVLQHLYQRDCLSVLWECGGTLAAQAIADGSVQKVWAFIAPKLIGGIQAPSPIGELGLTQMTDALTLHTVRTEAIASDWLIEGYLPIIGHHPEPDDESSKTLKSSKN